MSHPDTLAALAVLATDDLNALLRLVKISKLTVTVTSAEDGISIKTTPEQMLAVRSAVYKIADRLDRAFAVSAITVYGKFLSQAGRGAKVDPEACEVLADALKSLLIFMGAYRVAQAQDQQ
jgi:ABC-type enterochelin transport system ATPase subunit